MAKQTNLLPHLQPHPIGHTTIGHKATFAAREAGKWSLFSAQPRDQVKILLLKRNETMNRKK